MQIIPGIYQITTGTFNSVNTFLIAEETLTLIDTGFPSSAKQIIDFIHYIGRSEKEISLIIITHNHPDHTGGLTLFRKISSTKVAAHKADIASLPYQSSINRLIHIFPPVKHNFCLNEAQIDQLLSGGEVLPVLGGLDVIHTPGHTPGSISLLAVKYKILFVGDLINTRYGKLRIPYRIINSSTDEVKSSIRRIAKLDFDTVCVGHGKPLMKEGDVKVRRLAESLV